MVSQQHHFDRRCGPRIPSFWSSRNRQRRTGRICLILAFGTALQPKGAQTTSAKPGEPVGLLVSGAPKGSRRRKHDDLGKWQHLVKQVARVYHHDKYCEQHSGICAISPRLVHPESPCWLHRVSWSRRRLLPGEPRWRFEGCPSMLQGR